jgi:hypothetical protein
MEFIVVVDVDPVVADKYEYFKIDLKYSYV